MNKVVLKAMTFHIDAFPFPCPTGICDRWSLSQQTSLSCSLSHFGVRLCAYLALLVDMLLPIFLFLSVYIIDM